MWTHTYTHTYNYDDLDKINYSLKNSLQNAHRMDIFSKIFNIVFSI